MFKLWLSVLKREKFKENQLTKLLLYLVKLNDFRSIYEYSIYLFILLSLIYYISYLIKI